MQLKQKITFEYYNSLVKDKIRMHNSLIFFKGSEITFTDASMSKLARTISAVANSDGGEIIYGIAPLRGRAEKIEPVMNYNKDALWLNHELQAMIDKPVKDLQINITDIDQHSKIIHFIIPSCNGQPHMLMDNRYYKWQKNKTIVLDESEVRMMYGKQNNPDLEFLGVFNTNGLPVLNGGKYSSMSFYPKFLIRNAGNTVEKDYKIEISFPAKLYEESFQPLKSLFIRHDGSYVVFGQNGNHPLFQHEISTMIEAKIGVNYENIDSFINENINITIYFSNGIKKHTIRMNEVLTYNGKQLMREDFKNVDIHTIE